MFFSTLLHFCVMTSTDKGQDGVFKWVDNTDIQFSNWSPNFPRNTEKFWDCGQIYTGKGVSSEVVKTWQAAEDFCVSQNGHLVISIHSADEEIFMADYLRDIAHHVWIGLSDRLHEGKFAWTDGTSPVLFTNWAEKEPNNNDGQHCVSMTHNHLVTGLWNDENCGEKRGWVCYTKKSELRVYTPETLTKRVMSQICV
uniref:C-type lectin domain-containing protein n=1 Tax=Electrophorus electricus TaxID=8005 RepID=A0AAY5ECJ7_ELEEL